jgi:hypothetical protein
MAVNPADFYIDQSTIDSKIDTLITEIHELLEGDGGSAVGIIALLEEDDREFVKVLSTKSSQWTRDLRYIESKFKWYLGLSSLGATMRLIAEYADNYAVDVDVNKYNYVLDSIKLI